MHTAVTHTNPHSTHTECDASDATNRPSASASARPDYLQDRVAAVDVDVVTRPLLDDDPVDARLVDLVVDRYAAAVTTSAAQRGWSGTG